ncbi:hypothetical protein MALU111345_09900 [Marinicrinis lubricantis]
MLYVNDQDQAVKFWTEKAGFRVIAEEDNGQGMRWIEIAPSSGAETSIILHNKEFVAKMETDLNLGTPSLMFFTNNLDELYNDFSNKGVKGCLLEKYLTLRMMKKITLLSWRKAVNHYLCIKAASPGVRQGRSASSYFTQS